MYTLLSRIPNGLEPLRKKFEEHVKRSGLDAVQKVLPAPGAVSEAGKAEVLVSLSIHFADHHNSLGFVNGGRADLSRSPKRTLRHSSIRTPSTRTLSMGLSRPSWALALRLTR
jgi:hypothetical protein